MPRLILAFCTAALVLHSCAPEKEALTAQAASVKDSNELYAPAAFDWKTSRTCILELAGFEKFVTIYSTDGSVLWKSVVQNGQKNLEFTVPNHVTAVEIETGGIRVSRKVQSRMTLSQTH